MLIFKKKLYNNLFYRSKYNYSLYTYNRNISFNKSYYNLKKQTLCTIYIISQDKNKYFIKELSGILIKKNKMQNLTSLHLLCLKRYNNIYLSFFKEQPNILLKYKF
uniref:ORF-E n=1 Tax=Cyclospora cayetanensis TaxID=88456 RepID=A0A193BM97_9EIME|nr:ORF-E [Cyclospora cayetanensis]ANN13483.1 ORF-E [Cyclospora cayetanensis]